MSRRRKKSTKMPGSRQAPQGADRALVSRIPRAPGYDALDIRDTPLTARGAKLIYETLGSTDAGRLWALLALHPCGEYISSCDGIPDESMAAAVTPTYRAHTTISWNSKLFKKEPTPGDSFSYDIQIVTPPFPEIDYLYRLRYQGDWSLWVAVKLPSFPTSEVNPTATTVADLGMSRYRYVARGITLYLDAPRLSDNGRFIGGQVASPVQAGATVWNHEAVVPKGGGDPTYGEGTTHTYAFSVPADEDQLILQDNLVAQWPARDGAYIPHRFVSPVQMYQTTAGASGYSNAPVYKTDGTTGTVTVPNSVLGIVKTDKDGPTEDNAMEFYNAKEPYWVAPSGRGSIDPAKCVWGVSPPGNLYTGVAFFKAISGTASIQVKSRVYLEAEAAEPASPAAPFAHKPPCLDRQALDLVTKVAQVQPHVFYARDNDFSSILKSIAKMLPGIMGWVEPYADKLYKSGLPFIAPIGQGIGALTRGFRTAADHFGQ